MFRYDYDLKRWIPFKRKVTYTLPYEYYDDGGELPDYENLVVEDITFTEEELVRLETIKDLEEMSLVDVIAFVKGAELTDEPSKAMAEQADKTERKRKAFIQAVDLATIDQDLVADLAKKWDEYSYFEKGEPVEYNDVLYKVLQSHRAQSDWTPDVSPSLFAPILTSPTGEILPWVQPNSENYYRLGDKVTHNGKTWESMVDVNTWEPGAEGVDDRIWKAI